MSIPRCHRSITRIWSVANSSLSLNNDACLQMSAPLLLIHGEQDSNPGTRTMQSDYLYAALKGLGELLFLVARAANEDTRLQAKFVAT